MLKISRNNISFGYNLQYHQKYQETLLRSKSKQTQAKYLAELDKTCLQIEDEIVLMEKRKQGTKSEKYSNLTDILRELKTTIVFISDSCFPALNYADNTIQEYLDEHKTLSNENAKNWRFRICKEMKDYTTNKYPELEEESKEDGLFVPQFDNQGREIVKPDNQAIQAIVNSIKKDDKKEDFLEKFEPTFSTPKGFNDVVGMEEIKAKFQEDIIDYIKNPQLREKDEKEYAIRMPKGYILYGPPGCGKTYIIEALSQEADVDMYKLDISRVGSHYINKTSKNIQEAFDSLKAISQSSKKPVILFMDEIDSIALSRDGKGEDKDDVRKNVGTLLKLIEKARDYNIIVIGTTNRIDGIDKAFKERFSEEIFIGLPDLNQRINLLIYLLSKFEKGQKLAQDKENLRIIASELGNFSNRTITNIIDKAKKIAKRDSRSDVSVEHIRKAVIETEAQKTKEQDYKRQEDKKLIIGF